MQDNIAMGDLVFVHDSPRSFTVCGEVGECMVVDCDGGQEWGQKDMNCLTVKEEMVCKNIVFSLRNIPYLVVKVQFMYGVDSYLMNDMINSLMLILLKLIFH